MAKRLVRLFPVVTALCRKVKARHHAVDQVDLLIELRDLLARDKAVRREYQALFDHIFVDEFQDTDPLQAEIVVLLCEREARADRLQDVELSDGKLTLVGDPKQSIYRFRRAHIGMYERVRSLVASRPHLEVTLSANFRSRPSLVGWFNERFDRFLGKAESGKAIFRPDTGEVLNQGLVPGRGGGNGPSADSPTVHVLSFELAAGKGKVGEYRALEAEALGHYLRWLVEESRVKVRDPLTEELRPVGYGDVAVLALVTTNLPLLFAELDRMGVPHSVRGGRLFLQEPLYRQFLLGLRAVADRDDGIAEAALLRPPFFAIDLLDLVQERDTRENGEGGEGAARARAALDLVGELRRRRFERPPGDTARDPLDKTAFARAAALGPNGVQRLQDLREICLAIEHLAAREGLDYDGATAALREWVSRPIQLDPPFPIDGDAVQVMTVHQAKGLEFPVVVMWDGVAPLVTRPDHSEWRVAPESGAWVLVLQRLSWEEPPDLKLKEAEKRYLDAERKRLVYVEATRARDLLVLPKAGEPDTKKVQGWLVGKSPAGNVRELEPYLEGKGAPWSKEIEPAGEADLTRVTVADQEIRARWLAAAREAARPRFQPVGVASYAHLAEEDKEDEVALPLKKREGRYGANFGETVHRAIGIAMRDPACTAAEAVGRAAEETGLAHDLKEAATDVGRALEALRAQGLLGQPGPSLRLEYPIAGPGENGMLLVGFIDLVSAIEGHLDVIDFKTDSPPEVDPRQTHPEYVGQVLTYGRLLEAAGLCAARRPRCGLLYTADGRLRWV